MCIMPFTPSYVRQRRISRIGAEAFGTMQAFRTYRISDCNYRTTGSYPERVSVLSSSAVSNRSSSRRVMI